MFNKLLLLLINKLLVKRFELCIIIYCEIIFLQIGRSQISIVANAEACTSCNA